MKAFINKIRRIVHDLMCRNEFSCHIWWDVVSGLLSNGNCTQIHRRIFQMKQLLVYFQEALPSRINPIHGRTPLPLLLLARRIFRYPHGLQFGFLKVFLADHVHTCSRIFHKLSLLGFFRGCRRHNPLLRMWIDCSFVFLFFELKKMFLASVHASPRAHRSCLSISPGDLSTNFKS